MRARFFEFVELARSSFWYLPSLMMVAGLVLFALTLTIDKLGVTGGLVATIFYSGGVDNAVSLLQTLTGAMVAIATVVFSTMMVVLTLATSQFGHRLIRSFMRDRSNQAVLGIFLATFVFCLLVFHMVGNDADNNFVPGVSLTVGFVLAIFSTCTLIYFTHHMASLVAAPEVLEAVGTEFDGAIAQVYPPRRKEHALTDGHEDGRQDQRRDNENTGARRMTYAPTGRADAEILADEAGYIQVIGVASLRDLAAKHDRVIESVVGYGDHVVPGLVLARVHGGDINDDMRAAIAHQYVAGRERMTDHDLVFAINQVAEVGVRALSPALNNPYTALDCINRIAASLADVLARGLPDLAHVDDNGAPRFLLDLPDFACLLDAAFTPLRNYGSTSIQTMMQMLSAIEKLAELAYRDVEQQALRRQADALVEAAEHDLRETIDRERIKACHKRAVRAIAAVEERLPAAYEKRLATP